MLINGSYYPTIYGEYSVLAEDFKFLEKSGTNVNLYSVIDNKSPSSVQTDGMTYTVFIHDIPDEIKSKYDDSIQWAFKYWETVVPIIKFDITTKQDKADFAILWFPQENSNGRLGYVGCNTGIPYVMLTLDIPENKHTKIQLDDRELNKLIAHEIGHVLGFQHYDDQLNSVMSSIVFENIDGKIQPLNDQQEFTHDELTYCSLASVSSLADNLMKKFPDLNMVTSITDYEYWMLPPPLMPRITGTSMVTDISFSYISAKLDKQVNYSYSDSNKPIIFWLHNIENNVQKQKMTNIKNLQHELEQITTKIQGVIANDRLLQIKTFLNAQDMYIDLLDVEDEFETERRLDENSQYLTIKNTEKSKRYLSYLQEYLNISNTLNLYDEKENFYAQLNSIDVEKQYVIVQLNSLESNKSDSIKTEKELSLMMKYQDLSNAELEILEEYARFLSNELQITYDSTYKDPSSLITLKEIWGKQNKIVLEQNQIISDTTEWMKDIHDDDCENCLHSMHEVIQNHAYSGNFWAYENELGYLWLLEKQLWELKELEHKKDKELKEFANKNLLENRDKQWELEKELWTVRNQIMSDNYSYDDVDELVGKMSTLQNQIDVLNNQISKQWEHEEFVYNKKILDEQIDEIRRFIHKHELLVDEYTFTGFLHNNPKLYEEIQKLMPFYAKQEQVLSQRLS